MEGNTIIALLGVIVPLITSGIKKIFKTEENQVIDPKSLHTILPVLVGLAASGVNSYLTDGNWQTAILQGLTGGAVGSYVYKFNENVLSLTNGIIKIVGGLFIKK